MEECKYEMKNTKMKSFLNDWFEPSSSDDESDNDSDNETGSDSGNEPSNEIDNE